MQNIDAPPDMDMRESVVRWLWKVVEKMKWKSSAFFVAVHAMDTFMCSLSQEEQTKQISLISTACLFLAVATEEDYPQLSKARHFVGHVPTVDSVKTLFAAQLDVLSYIKRPNLMIINRTPHDFAKIFLSRIIHSSEPLVGERIFQYETTAPPLSMAIDALAGDGYEQRLHFKVSGRKIVAVGLLAITIYISPPLDIESFCRKVAPI
eukprot:GHVO01050982.1.p1 GENE.GHVO01050982.1~~GHVO01050982.1.p1  ORF type:complete len:214 (+),score=16.91 GHVO01050982.1:24-644(+)